MHTLRRTALASALAAGLLATAGTATAITPATQVTMTKVFKTVLPKVQDRAGIPIRIPRTVYLSSSSKLYASGRGDTNSYSLELAFAPNCGNATACFAADFLAVRGGPLQSGQTVALTKGISGRFRATSCGASCAPPSIAWRQNGVVYTLQVPGGSTNQAEREALISYANAAIKAPRL